MLNANRKMPTLGYLNKIVCEILGLWSSEDKDVVFNVSAKEKERRRALKEAFNAVERKGGSYGTLDDLINVTTKVYPHDRVETKKIKTVQSYANHLSKEDFCSYDEFVEFREYIDIVISEKFTKKSISNFSSRFYSSSMMHYREFVREHAAKPEYQLDSYVFFINQVLVNLIESLADTSMNAKAFCFDSNDSRWPLRSFVDTVAELCGVSLHKLHQFHEVRLNSKFRDEEIWHKSLTGKPINTRSKQIIDRLSKDGKIKWDTFCFVIKPFIYLLPEGIGEDDFWVKAYSAFLMHNIYKHVSEIEPGGEYGTPTPPQWHYPVTLHEGFCIPVSDRIDFLINNDEPADEVDLRMSMDNYNDLINKLRRLSYSLIKDFEAPSVIYYSYNQNYVVFPIDPLRDSLIKTPLWIDEWILAKDAVLSSNSAVALNHYKKSLEEAKYVAGPLFIHLYVEICAFCKYQYRRLKEKGEEHLFDRFYEPLGSAVTEYATLVGYTPGFYRDYKTLMPKSLAPRKSTFMMRKIDSMSSLLA